MPEFDTIPDAVLGLGDSDDDYTFGDAVSLLDINKLPTEDAFIPPVNQASDIGGVMSSFCTGINPFRTVLALDNHDMPDSLKKEVREYAVKNNGYQEKKWNYVVNGMNMAKNMNAILYPKVPIMYFKTTMLSPDHIGILAKWYKSIVCYNGSTEYNQDYKKDSVLDGAVFGKRTYGHCTVLEAKQNKLFINDSYHGTKYNNYEIKQMSKLVANGVFYQPTYFFVRDPNGVIYSKQMAYEEEKLAALNRAKTRGVTNGDNMTANDYRYLVRLYRLNK